MATLAPLTRRRRGALEGGRSRLGTELRRRFVDSGPLAASFGIYLGTRIDLFAGTDCLALLGIPDRAAASDPTRVSELVEREMGESTAAIFEHFEAQPFESGLLFQWHRARLTGGSAVHVQLLHPELEPELADGRLSRLAERLTLAGELPAQARASVDDFERRLDLLRASDALRELEAETLDSTWVETPAVRVRLASSRLRVLDAVEPRSDCGVQALEGRARRLARSWLTMVLRGDLFPAEPWGRNVSYREDGRMAFTGAQLHRLPRSLRTGLREYLTAVAGREAARAAQAFVDLLPGRAGSRRLRHRLRHSEPFRDRRWDVGGDLFVRQVLAHWSSAKELGFSPPEGLTPFYRGLFLLNQEARRLAGDAESVRNGFREARLVVLFGELRDDAEAGVWARALERQMGLVSGLPRKLDRILTLAEEGDRLEGQSDRGHNRSAASRVAHRPSVWAVGAACVAALTALIAVVLMTHHVAETAALGPWAERLGALVVLLLGGLLLRALTRPEPG